MTGTVIISIMFDPFGGPGVIRLLLAPMEIRQ